MEEYNIWYFYYALAHILASIIFLKILDKKANRIQELKKFFSAPILFSFFLLIHFAGWVGARFLNVISENFLVIQNGLLSFGLSEFFSISGMTFYGGFLLSLVIAMMFLKLLKLPLLPIFDCAFPATCLGLAIGRIGCFINNDDFGMRWPQGALEWGEKVQFSLLEMFGERIPVQLEESLVNMGLCLGCVLALRKWTHDGVIGFICLGLSVINRFFIEFYRADPRAYFSFFSLYISQVISLLILIVLIIAIFFISFSYQRNKT